MAYLQTNMAMFLHLCRKKARETGSKPGFVFLFFCKSFLQQLRFGRKWTLTVLWQQVESALGRNKLQVSFLQLCGGQPLSFCGLFFFCFKKKRSEGFICSLLGMLISWTLNNTPPWKIKPNRAAVRIKTYTFVFYWSLKRNAHPFSGCLLRKFRGQYTDLQPCSCQWFAREHFSRMDETRRSWTQTLLLNDWMSFHRRDVNPQRQTSALCCT